MKLYNHLKLAAGILTLAIASSTPAFATPTLLLSDDSGTSWTVGSTDGAYNYIGGWSLSVKGSKTLSDLLDVTAISRSPGSLTLRFFETGLTLDSINGIFKNQAGGLVADSAALVLNTYIDPSNNGFLTMPSTAVQLTGQTLFGYFDETVISQYVLLPSDQFSLMLEATILLRGAGGATDFSQTLRAPTHVPDGGSTLALLGAALVGFGWFSRSRKATA